MNYNIQSYDFGAASFNMLGRFVQGISGVTIDTTDSGGVVALRREQQAHERRPWPESQ